MWLIYLTPILGRFDFFLQTSHYCILVHLSWILIKTRRQDLIITIPEKSTTSTNFIIPHQIFNQFEYVSSNLHLVLSSLTTLTTSPTQFIRNPLRTITRVPAHHSSFYFRIICNILFFLGNYQSSGFMVALYTLIG